MTPSVTTINSKANEDMSTSDPVYFWNPDGTPQSFLSQWYPCDPPFLDTVSSESAEKKEHDVRYHTTEMYMMHRKALHFQDHEIAQTILEAATPEQQKQLGRKVRGFDSGRWNQVREAVVERGNACKFRQCYVVTSEHRRGEMGTGRNESLKELLLRTGDAELVEASPEDEVWGVGFGAEEASRVPRERWGLNLLGKVLMRVREGLRKEEQSRRQ
ncbi:MAG: hypothetical protein M1831_005431 [Alyxoria varia]|nr:MAG: hypothetical protein M1831_005431 [Alyxoria varia]